MGSHTAVTMNENIFGSWDHKRRTIKAVAVCIGCTQILGPRSPTIHFTPHQCGYVTFYFSQCNSPFHHYNKSHHSFLSATHPPKQYQDEAITFRRQFVYTITDNY